MKTVFKISAESVVGIKADLRRRHRFAAERVGFIHCYTASLPEGGVALFASEYRPVDDEDYLDDPSVGAMMGSGAISKALQASYKMKTSVFHVHMHDHRGPPRFSGIDLRENSKFVPDFFNVSPSVPHGAIVLSDNSAIGIIWKSKHSDQELLDEIVIVGAPLIVIRRQLP